MLETNHTNTKEKEIFKRGGGQKIITSTKSMVVTINITYDICMHIP